MRKRSFLNFYYKLQFFGVNRSFSKKKKKKIKKAKTTQKLVPRNNESDCH